MKRFKQIIILIIVFILIITYIFLSKEECASCGFVYNESSYNGYCPEMCFRTQKWKILLFKITGDNFDYKY